MKVRADATPLAAPLPGGSEGASVVVEPMQAGSAHWPRDFYEFEGGRIRRWAASSRPAEWSVPCPTYLVTHPTAGLILIDTGLHPSVASDPRLVLGRTLGRFFSLERGQDVISRLRARRLEAEDVRLVVLTHLHVDHASSISEFPESTFVFSEAEWREACEGTRPTFHGYRRALLNHAFDYRTVDFDGGGIGSYGSFGRTFDLLGDGSVRLAYTPGHTPGHVSVILRLPRRDFVVAGDAIYTWRQLEGGALPAMVDDEHNWRRSLRELQSYHRAYPYAVIVPGHDPDFWPKLDARYEE